MFVVAMAGKRQQQSGSEKRGKKPDKPHASLSEDEVASSSTASEEPSSFMDTDTEYCTEYCPSIN